MRAAAFRQSRLKSRVHSERTRKEGDKEGQGIRGREKEKERDLNSAKGRKGAKQGARRNHRAVDRRPRLFRDL